MSERELRRARRVRRALAWILLSAGAAALIVGALRWGRQSAAPEVSIERGEYSLLLITVDTTRADRLEPYGADDVATPRLAELAREGVVFERAYSVAPITLVAHTSILTGLDPPLHGVRNNGTHYVRDDLETLAERLRDDGYRTAAFVSAAVLESRYNLDQGFETYDDDLSAGRERHPRMVPDRPAEATVSAARTWLDGVAPDEPFFLWVHLYDPHAAYSPPPPYRDQYRERLYDGEIAYMDEWIGHLLDHERISEKVAVTVLGDHGESLGEHREQTHALLAYDSTLHVPWIMRLPDGPRGLRVPVNVGQVDWLPTMLDLLGRSSNPRVTGRSVLPLLGRGRRDVEDRPLYAETWLPYYTYGWARLQSWRQGRYKWITAPTPELYDTRRDPRELSNIVEQQPGLAHDLRRDLDEFLASHDDATSQASLELDSEAREQLRSLGYLAVGSGAAEREGPRPDPKEMIDLHVGLERARFLIRDRLYESAERELRDVLTLDPSNLAAMIDLSTVLAEQGEIDEAAHVVEEALDLDPAYARLYLILAGLESRRGQFDRSLELYDAAFEIDPRSIELRMQKAVLLDRLGRSDEAASLLSEALEDDPESAPLNVVYARLVELRRGDPEAAEARLRRALERDPFITSGWRLLGSVLERTGRTEEAVTVYREGLTRSVDDPELHAQLGILLAQLGGDKQAESHLREALRLTAGARPEVHVALGAWLAEHGRFQEALEEYQEVLEERPRHPGALNNRAIALFQTGQLEEAEAELRRLIEHHPRHADAQNNLAAIALGRADLAEAESRSRRALELQPDMAEAWNNLGLSLAGRGAPREAESAYRKALELEPDYWQARLNLGRLLASMEQWQEARVVLSELIREHPRIPDGHLELGRLYAGPLDDPESARTHLNAFLRIAPGHPEVESVRNRLDELGR